MSVGHVSTQQLEALQRGRIGPAEAASIGAHVRGCPQCAAAVAEASSVARHAAAIHRQLDRDDEAVQPRRRMRLLFRAAAAMLLIGLAAVGLYRMLQGVREPAEVRPAERVVRTDPHATPAVAHTGPPVRPQYARAGWTDAVTRALETGKLPIGVVTSLRRPAAALRGQDGPAGAPASLRPQGEVVESVRPQFQWPAAAGATYVVLLFANEDSVATSETLSAPRWTPPVDLAPERTYAWQVQVTTAEGVTLLPRPPDPPALFRVLDEKGRAELAAARRAHPDDHLLLAVLYAQHGVVARAREELREYARSGDAKRVEELLQSLKTP